jgi:F0F1-type ATP synthase membrane subunit b/b'
MKDKREKSGNMDQIRELMFGAQIREYNIRFDKLDSELSTLSQDMHKRIDEVNNTLSDALHTAIESLNKEIKSLALTNQEERADLQQKIERIDGKFTNRFESLSEETDKSTNNFHKELSQTRGKLQQEIQDLRTKVFDELQKRLSSLGEAKVSKDSMAEILFEVGMKLKGTELISDLQEMVDFDEDEVPEDNNKDE